MTKGVCTVGVRVNSSNKRVKRLRIKSQRLSKLLRALRQYLGTLPVTLHDLHLKRQHAPIILMPNRIQALHQQARQTPTKCLLRLFRMQKSRIRIRFVQPTLESLQLRALWTFFKSPLQRHEGLLPLNRQHHHRVPRPLVHGVVSSVHFSMKTTGGVERRAKCAEPNVRFHRRQSLWMCRRMPNSL